MSQRFPATARLRTRAEFTRVQDGGRRVTSRYFTLLGQPNGLPHDRLGVIASRRVGNAVTRNRAKRRMRELFRRLPATVPAAPAVQTLDLVVIARSDVAHATYAALEQDFSTILRKLRGRAS